MKPSTLLRIGSAISLLHFVGHTAGIPWTPSDDPGSTSVLSAMKSYRFDVTGVERTYWDFYLGFGLIISVYLLVQALALWQLGTMSRKDAISVRPLVALFGLGSVANATLAWKFFFSVPLVLAIAVSLCLGLALTAARTMHPSEETSPTKARI